MKRVLFLASAGILTFALTAGAEEPTQSEPTAEPVKATFLITGLHCQPCTRTVQSSLRGVEGVRSVKVDWKTKNAWVEFDEAVLPAQKLAQRIADTPHMMGSDMTYGAWLALKVPKLRDKATGIKVKDTLSKLAGVRRVVAYPARQALGVQFGEEGEVTSRQLIDALHEAGFDAENFQAKKADRR